MPVFMPAPLFFTSTTRLLDLKTPLPDGTLLVECFTGWEAVSELFRFDIICVSRDAFLDPEALRHQEITLRLLLADGRRRPWHGIVTEIEDMGADGGLARYRLTVEPWLALLRERGDCYLYQDKTVLDILGQLFADYPAARWSHAVTQPLRPYSRCTQYRETDLEFVLRLLAEEGLSFYFRHAPGDDADAGPGAGAGSGASAPRARHELVVIDRASPWPEGAQPTIRFHRAHATEATDTLQVWQEHRAVRANAVTLAGWDYATLQATGAETRSTLDNGELPLLELHDASRAYRFEDTAAATLRTDLAMTALEAGYHRFDGESSVRALAPGTVFTLTQHDGFTGDAARFAVLSVAHYGTDTLRAHGADAASSFAGTAFPLAPGSYRNRLTAKPAARPVATLPRPASGTGLQTALVVGVPGAALTTERDHRLKVQFPWQRGVQPNPGGLTDLRGAGKTGNAPGNEQSGTWVRVAEWLAGPNWGGQFLPRLGTEVLVDFVEGDADRPIVVGQHYNGADRPPFSAGQDAAANHPGVLSGWMSHNFTEGFNQWVADDAPAQVRTRLATSEQAGQLGLGYLIHQAPHSATRGPWRGSGFEWRSDGWLAVRAGEGLLLSATARPAGGGTQMEVPEAVGQLRAAADTARRLADAAAAQAALPLVNAPQDELLRAIDARRGGVFSGSVGGQEARKAEPGSRTLGAATERFAAPWIVSEAPGDIGLSSPASALAFAGGNLHATVQGDWHGAARHTWAASVGDGASWFCHSGGIKSIAAAGSQTLQAHTDTLEVLADEALTVTSSNDEIQVLARRKIVLLAANSSITLEGGNITFVTPGSFSVKGSNKALTGPGRGTAEIEGLPDTRAKIFDEQFRAIDKSTGQPLVGIPYRITRADGETVTGITDERGRTLRVATADPENLRITWLPVTDDNHLPDDADEDYC